MHTHQQNLAEKNTIITRHSDPNHDTETLLILMPGNLDMGTWKRSTAIRVLAAPSKETRRQGGMCGVLMFGGMFDAEASINCRNFSKSSGSSSCWKDLPCKLVLVMSRCFRQSETTWMRRLLSRSASPSQIPRSIPRKLYINDSASEQSNCARMLERTQVSRVCDLGTQHPHAIFCHDVLPTPASVASRRRDPTL